MQEGMEQAATPQGEVNCEHCRAVLARLAECERDAARLDWLEGTKLDPFTVTDLVCEWRWNNKRHPTGLRDVLDAAREGVRHGT